MSCTYRWYKIHCPHGVDSLFSVLESSKFDPMKGAGFVFVGRERGDSVYKYISSSSVNFTTVDDDGILTRKVLATVRETDFSIIGRDGQNYLKVRSPTISVKSLLNALELVAGFGFTCRLITFSHKEVCKLLTRFDAFDVVGLSVGDAAIADGVVATMDFKSPNGLQPEELRVLEGMRFRTTAASYLVALEGIRGKLSWKSSGIVSVGGKLGPMIIGLVESKLGEFK